MIDLKGVKVPDHFNGLGLHDTAGSEVATLSYQEARRHGQEVRDHGITLYKLFGGTTKVQRAKAYVELGITVAMRFWVYKPWSRNPGMWVTPADQVKQFVDVGVQMFELGWNEFNISDEYPEGMYRNDPEHIARLVVDAWEEGLGGAGKVNGAQLLFPSNTPGGNTPHRLCYQAIVAELTGRHLLSTVTHIAVHPRPHNNPPDSVWTERRVLPDGTIIPANTVTFDEWRWIRDLFGGDRVLWATEHGYSLKDDQNHTLPQIDLGMWTEYNWQLFERMNPAHPKAIEPELGGIFYWVERGWGHWGAWGKDALVDSPVPEMPAPSPLWVRMGEKKDKLAFQRCAKVVPPRPDYNLLDLVGKLPVGPVPYPARLTSMVDLSVLHYSWVTPPAANEKAEIAQINSIARGHIRMGYPGIAYHYIVGPSGVVYKGNRLDRSAYHCYGHNAHSVGICVLLRQGSPTPEQVNSTALLLRDLGYPMKLHKQIPGSKTLCPGTILGPAVLKAMEEPVEPPRPAFRIEYRDGLNLVIGNYPKAGAVLSLVAPWGLQVAAEAGTKLEYGPGGFELVASDDHSTYNLVVEGKTWPVQMVPGKSAFCVWG